MGLLRPCLEGGCVWAFIEAFCVGGVWGGIDPRCVWGGIDPREQALLA
jgi:hypothetical protein